MPFRLALLAIVASTPPMGWARQVIREETPQEAAARHDRVATRRSEPHVICHRGASEFAHENTLAAFRAALELGADGNEVDIRATRDGALVTFHDDTVDRLLFGQGEVEDYTWDDLQRLPFREPGPLGQRGRIPTLTEVFELHRKTAGLLHLDIKMPGLDRAVADLLDRLDLWDHVAYCNPPNADAILADRRLTLCRYKAPGLYDDGSNSFPEVIAEYLARPGEGLIVDDPRAAIVALGRTVGAVTRSHAEDEPSRPQPLQPPPSEEELVRILSDADDWNRVAESAEEQEASAARIRRRARAADLLLLRGTASPASPASPAALAALEKRVRQRSLHADYRVHGVDGAAALRALLHLQAPGAVGEKGTGPFFKWTCPLFSKTNRWFRPS